MLLSAVVAARQGEDQRVAALRALAQRIERSPDPEYRTYQLRLNEFNCAFASRLHNATTAAQREKARENLQGWATDLRALLND